MLEKIRSFLSDLGSTDPSRPDSSAFSPDDPRLAAAALLYHIVRADGVMRQVEIDTLMTVLQQEYALDSGRLDELVQSAKQADDEAVDFYRFTNVLMKHMSREQCIGFVELMWEIVYADGVRHELEDNVVWRIAELLGVSGRERVVMRQRVQERMGIADAGDS